MSYWKIVKEKEAEFYFLTVTIVEWAEGRMFGVITGRELNSLPVEKR